MKHPGKHPVDVLIVAIPQTAGSALYGMVDVLSAAGNIWLTLVRGAGVQQLFRIRIASTRRTPFACGHGIPVRPDVAIDDDPIAPIVIVPELWLGPDETITGRYPRLVEWLRRAYKRGAALYSACSGAAILAETGLLDGCPATSHWGYEDLFRARYPKVRFDPAPQWAIRTARSSGGCSNGSRDWGRGSIGGCFSTCAHRRHRRLSRAGSSHNVRKGESPPPTLLR
jgi:transcriptional regulator GlxA family with amidase domain